MLSARRSIGSPDENPKSNRLLASSGAECIGAAPYF
jgi:hypothetical protein